MDVYVIYQFYTIIAEIKFLIPVERSLIAVAEERAI